MKTLNKIKTGKVVKFGYVDGEHTPYYGKVVDHRDLEKHPLAEDTYRKNPNLERSKFLTTVAMPQNKNKVLPEYDSVYQQFYHIRTLKVKPVGLLGRILLWFKWVRFGYGAA